MSGPSTTNTTATSVSTTIGTAGSSLVYVAEGLIIADLPFLSVPVVKQIWEALFSWIASYFIIAAQQMGIALVIDAQVSKEESGLSGALAALIQAEKGGNQDAIKQAIKDYQAAQSALVHFDGSVNS